MPPDIRPNFDDNHWWGQTLIIVYNQIREHEENEILNMQMKIMASVPRL
jgi:hypothetical protein